MQPRPHRPAPRSSNGPPRRPEPSSLGRRIVRTLMAMIAYTGFAWIVVSLAAVAAQQLALPRLFLTLLIVMLFCGFLLAALLAWRYDQIGSWSDVD